MTSGLSRWAVAAAVAAGGLALSAGGPSAAAPQAPAATDPLIPKTPDEVSTGFAGCRQCHNEKRPIDAKDNDFVKRYRSNEYVLLSEGRTWRQQDPHSAAHDVLTRPLGQQMSKLLKYDVTKAAQCLTCHAIDTAPGLPLAQKKFEHFETSEGITCNACHGLRKPWQMAHYEEKAKTIPWRLFDPAKKQEAGLRNLRDPAVKAAFCASCHVGSAAEGRVVTHEMYAAGHPPLPPFELGTFMDCQPKHWGYPTDPELKYFTPEGAAAFAEKAGKSLPDNWTWGLYRFHPPAAEVYLARSVAAGAVAALQAEMRMIAADAAGAGGPGYEGVDYARFDCYACHHDLQVPSARQARGYEGKPGRPPLKAWIAALPGVVADHAAGLPPLAATAKDFHAKWAAVRTAALARPFGDPVPLKAAADDMAKWCGEFLAKSDADGKPLYTDAEAKKLLAAIGAAATSPKWTADPEAAMHLTWAYLSLRGSMKDPPPGPALEALGKTIPTRVRFEPYSTPDGDPQPAGVQIGARLDLFRKYQPAAFTDRFNALLKK
jgi:hypothetical protein